MTMDAEGTSKGNLPKNLAVTAVYLLLFAGLVFAGFKLIGPVEICGSMVPRSLIRVVLREKTLTSQDVEKLNAMPGLEEIELYNCRVEDGRVDALRMSFEGCSFEENAFEDAHLKAREFSIKDGGGLNDYLFLEDAPALKKLTLSGAGLSDAGAPDLSASLVTYYNVPANPELTRLDWISPDAETLICSDSGIASLDGVAAMEKLTTLVCDRVPCGPPSKALRSVYLTTLSMQETGLKDLTCLEGLTILQDVNLSYNKLENIDILEQNKDTLTWLDLSSNPLKASAQKKIGSFGELERLYADDIELENTSFIGDLTNLSDLSLINCGLDELPPLEKLTSLKRLRLAFNQISDISQISELKSLTCEPDDAFYPCIDLAGNEISDITPLIGFGTGVLSLIDNPVDLSLIAEGDTPFSAAASLIIDYADGLEDCKFPSGHRMTSQMITNIPLNAKVAVERAFSRSHMFEDRAGLLDYLSGMAGHSTYHDRYGSLSYRRWETLFTD